MTWFSFPQCQDQYKVFLKKRFYGNSTWNRGVIEFGGGAYGADGKFSHSEMRWQGATVPVPDLLKPSGFI